METTAFPRKNSVSIRISLREVFKYLLSLFRGTTVFFFSQFPLSLSLLDSLTLSLSLGISHSLSLYLIISSLSYFLTLQLLSHSLLISLSQFIKTLRNLQETCRDVKIRLILNSRIIHTSCLTGKLQYHKI